MGLFIFLIILYMMQKKDKRNSDIFKGVIGAGIVVAILSSVLSFSSIPGILLFLVIYLIMRNRNASSDKKQEEENAQRQRQWQQQHQQQQSQQANNRQQQTWQQQTARPASGGPVKSQILPRTVAKRTKIVQNFNRQFTLSLTETEIKRIVDASYLSEAWKREVEAMAAKYETVYEWFLGTTNWLRVYIYVFQIQNISSDFARQEQICMETFDEVMQYAESLHYATMDERINKVNDRFFTCFDETSFMIAYRFMQRKGKKYDLEKIDIVKNEDEIERMAQKYEAMN